MINKTYTINTLLNEDNMINVIDKFWDDTIHTLKSDESVVVIVRLEKTNNYFITLTIMQMNLNNKPIFYSEIRKKANNYYGTFIERVEIIYNIKVISDSINDSEALLVKTDTKYHTYLHYRLPITNKPINYGTLIHTYDNIYISQLLSNNLLLITVIGENNYVEMYKKGEKIMDWIDRKITDNIFIRYIGGNEYVFENTITNK